MSVTHPNDSHAKASRRFTATGASEHFCPAMSTASQSQPSSVECRNPACDEYGPRWEFIENKYCTHGCEIEHEGHKALSKIKHDHCYCYTCGTALKLVHRPEGPIRGIAQTPKGDPNDPPDVRFVYKDPPEHFIGIQGTLPESAWGEKSHPKDDRYVRSGAVCDHCGSTDHRERIEELFGSHWGEYADRLLAVLEAETDTRIDADTFWRTFDGENFEYSVGKAVEG